MMSISLIMIKVWTKQNYKVAMLLLLIFNPSIMHQGSLWTMVDKMKKYPKYDKKNYFLVRFELMVERKV